MGVAVVSLPGEPPYLAIDLSPDGDRPAERLNVAITPAQLADLLPDAVRVLRGRLTET